MYHKLTLNLIVMYVFSVLLAIVSLATLQPVPATTAYTAGYILGRALASTLLPALVVAIPAGIYRYFARKHMRGYYVALWVLWLLFGLVTLAGNLTNTASAQP